MILVTIKEPGVGTMEHCVWEDRALVSFLMYRKACLNDQ